MGQKQENKLNDQKGTHKTLERESNAASAHTHKTLDRVQRTIIDRNLASAETPIVLMISGGSDSTALAYICSQLCEHGDLGHIAALHVNHCIRGKEADADQEFVEKLCEVLNIPLYVEHIDVPAIVQETGDNMEAVARRERYRAATQLLHNLCAQTCTPNAQGRIFTAHTQDDRVENFYMRSIVGTGPGGFRSMRYLNGNVARPCLDVSKQDLRDYLLDRERAGEVVARRCAAQTGACSNDQGGEREVAAQTGAHEGKQVETQVSTQAGTLWCEDATNAHTDMFRAFVRHEIVPVARQRNTSLLDTLSRTMNLIADEDDFMDALAQDVFRECVEWMEDSCRLLPVFGEVALVLQRRVILKVLQQLLGEEVRVETSSVNAILDAFVQVGAEDSGKIDTANTKTPTDAGASSYASENFSAAARKVVPSPASENFSAAASAKKPKSGYSTNIQGNLAVSANKHGVLIEPMSAYRRRRGRA